MNLFRPNEGVKDYHIRKPNDANFLSKIEDKRYIHVGKNIFTFETNDEMVNHSSELCFNDNKYPFASGEENICFMLHQKYIPIQEYVNSTVKNENEHLYKKDEELKGNDIADENQDKVEYGNDLIKCKIIHSK